MGRYTILLGQHITGGQLGFRDVLPLLQADSGWEQHWDEDSQTPYLSKGSREIWYDDAESLRMKARLAGSLGVVQLGMWTANAVDYGESGAAASLWDAMSLHEQV